MLSPRQLTGTVAFFTGVGCATAVVDEDPGSVVPTDGTGTGAIGGTMVAGVGGSGASASGGAGTGGTTSVAGGPGSAGTGVTSGAGRSGVGAAGRPSGLGMGGTGATGGSNAVATGGRAMVGGSGRGTTSDAGTGAGGGAAVACPDPRMPLQPGALQGNSGSFETTEAVCYFVEGTFNNWSCSNPGGRTVTINGKPSMCGGALPEKADGGYYFEFGASTDGTNYTSFYWYTS